MDLSDAAGLGFDPDRLRRADEFLRVRYLESGLLPHVQLLVAREGRPAHFFSEGAAREGGPAIDDRSLFRIASMTKPFASLALIMLMEEGRVMLWHPVSRYLPEFKDAKVGTERAPAEREMTVLDLLRHTAGLTYGFHHAHAVDELYRAAGFEWSVPEGLDLAGCVEACSALAAVGDRVIPKSSLSNHFKILREAGLIRSERAGVEVRNHSRWDEIEARFPGLLPGIINAYAATPAGHADGIAALGED